MAAVILLAAPAAEAKKRRPHPITEVQTATAAVAPAPLPPPVAVEAPPLPEPELVMPPSAPEPPAPAAPAPPSELWDVGVKAGVSVARPSAQGTVSPDVVAEADYRLLAWLSLYADIGYAQGTRRLSGDDARLPGGSYTYHLTARQLGLTTGVLARWPLAGWPVVPYAIGGIHWTAQQVHGSGQAGAVGFSDSDLLTLQAGVCAAAGVEYALGPGNVTAELGAVYLLPVHTGVAAGATLQLGYRWRF